jgi:hypothetical protein
MGIDDRYDRDHSYGEVTFHLSSYYPNVEECRFLLMKVIEQAVRDYCALYDAELPAEKTLWESSRDFIFDDEYVIDWGGKDMRFEDVLDVLDLDIHWFREQTQKKFKARLKENGNKEGQGTAR